MDNRRLNSNDISGKSEHNCKETVYDEIRFSVREQHGALAFSVVVGGTLGIDSSLKTRFSATEHDGKRERERERRRKRRVGTAGFE